MRREASHPASWSEDRQATLRDYLVVLHRRWRIVAGAFLAALVAAVAMSLIVPPTFRATATVTTDTTPQVMLLSKSGGLSDLSLSADQGAGQAPDIATLVELIKSSAVREGALERLAPIVSSGVANAALDGLTVQQVRQTELLRVSVDYTDARIAAQAANAVAESLIDMNQKARRQRASATREFIEREMQDASARLRGAEDTLVEFHDRHRDISLTEEITLNVQKLADLKAQLVDVRLQQDTAESRIAAARERLAGQARLTPTQWTPSPLIASLQDQLAKLEVELSGLRREFTQQHPAVLSTLAKIDETKQRLAAELAKDLRPGTYGVDPVYQQLHADRVQAEVTLATLRTRERAMQDAIATYEGQMRGVPLRQVSLTRLTRDVKEFEQIYLLLSDRYEQARIAESSIGSVIRVTDPAKVPTTPVKPRRQMNTLFGGVLGLMVGVVGALLTEQFDDTVKSAEEIERVLGAPVLGAIPIVNGEPTSIARPPNTKSQDAEPEDGVLPLPIAATDPRSPAAEAYRALRTHVLFSMPDVERKRLLVSSALPREGKSTIVANLGVAIARSDRRVWLIDGDLRKPALGRWFEGAGSPGLAGLLAGQVEVENVVRPTAEPKLWYVESGLTAPNPSELLGSQRMARLMERAQAQADVVLVDSPPMLPVTDAEVLAGQAVDGVLLVVKAGQTSRRALAHVRKRLERVGAKLVGAVLNGVAARAGDIYDYGSYYYADYGPEDKDKSHGKAGSERKNHPEKKLPRRIILAALAGVAIALVVYLVLHWFGSANRARTPHLTGNGRSSGPSQIMGGAGTIQERRAKAWQLLRAGHLGEAQGAFLRILYLNITDQDALHGLVVVQRQLAADDRVSLRQRAQQYQAAIARGVEIDEHYSLPAMRALALANAQAVQDIEARSTSAYTSWFGPLPEYKNSDEKIASPAPNSAKPARRHPVDVATTPPPGAAQPRLGVVAGRTTARTASTGRTAPSSSASTPRTRAPATSTARTSQPPLASASQASSSPATPARTSLPPPATSAQTPGAPAAPTSSAFSNPRGWGELSSAPATPTLRTSAPPTTSAQPSPPPASAATAKNPLYLVRVVLLDRDRALATAEHLSASGFPVKVAAQAGFRVVSEPLPRSAAEGLRATLAGRGIYSQIEPVAQDAAQLLFGSFTSQKEAEALSQRIGAYGYDAWVRGGISIYVLELGRYSQPTIEAIIGLVKAADPGAAVNVVLVP